MFDESFFSLFLVLYYLITLLLSDLTILGERNLVLPKTLELAFDRKLSKSLKEISFVCYRMLLLLLLLLLGLFMLFTVSSISCYFSSLFCSLWDSVELNISD